MTVDPRLERFPVGAVEYFSTEFTDESGASSALSTAVLLPPGASLGDNLPTIVEQYGGVDLSTFGSTFGGWFVGSIPAHIFTSRGFQVLLVDLPLGPEGEPANLMSETTARVLAQVNNAIDLGYVNPDRMVLTGQSFGGYGVAAILVETDIFQAGIAVAGVFDLPNLYAWDLDDFGIFWSEFGQGRMGAPLWSDPERYIANSPYYHADQITTPLLLVHGMADTTTPYQESQKLFASLRWLGADAELILCPTGGHVITEWQLADAIDVTERVLTFLENVM